MAKVDITIMSTLLYKSCMRHLLEALFMAFLAYRDILCSIEAGFLTIFPIFNYISEMVKKDLYTIQIMHEAFILG